MIKTSLLALLISSTVFAIEAPLDVLQTGDKVSKELLQQLGSKLKHEIGTNGLIAAAAFCNEQAYTLTEEINLHQVEGVSVKRVSLKERNPANMPSADEKIVLELLQSLVGKKEFPPYIIEKEGQVYKYYKPLVIKQDVCLKCHGDVSKNPELSTFLKEHYPEDKAIGYKMNDLRGAVVVEIKK